MQVDRRSPLLRLRRATDDAFIAGLSARAFSEYHLNPEWTTLEMAHRGCTWLAWNAERPLGFVIYEGVGATRAALTAIAVDERARGSGVGAALLVHAERELAAGGTRELRLFTAAANLSALDLFSKRGFQLVRRVPRFYRNVFDACLLSKPLCSAAR